MKKKISFNEMPEALETLMAMSAQILDAAKTPKTAEFSHKNVKEILSVKEVCELLGINRTTLWMWEKKKVVQSYGLEGRKFFKRSEILELLIPLN